MKIADALKGVNKLAIETAPYIYYVENHPLYADKMDAIFAIIEAQTIEMTASVITLTEVLKKPIQVNDQPLIDAYSELLTQNTHLIPTTVVIARLAADLRARYNLRTPDALHIATAINASCDAFLTNDLGLKRVTELKVLVLDELELPADSEA